MDDAEKLAPVRLCCGQRHFGPVCPDGLVMCCLCFQRFPIEQLNQTPDGPEDVCRDCAQAEQQQQKLAERGR